MIRLGVSLTASSSALAGPIDPLDLDPYLYFDGSENVITDGGAVASWGQRSAGDNQLSRSLAQGTASLQPDNSGSLAVKFDGSDDKLAFDVAVAQAGILIAATSNGIFAYEVDADSVDEITALGYEKGFFFDLDLYAYVLLPASVTDSEIEKVIKWLDANTNATKNPTGALLYYWRNRTDLVAPKFDALDFSGVTSLRMCWFNSNSQTSFPLIDTSNVTTVFGAWGSNKFTSFPKLDTSSVTNFNSAWQYCNALTSFPIIDTSSATDVAYAWYLVSSLTTFPALDLSSVTTFAHTWRGCTALTSFPALDLSSGTNFGYTWYDCTALTSFPAVTFSTDASDDIDFSNAWYNCTSMTSFPALNLSRGTNFTNTWRNTALATFPALALTAGTNFSSAWTDCTSLSSFLATGLDSGTNFSYAWRNCTAFTSFPTLDLSSGTNFFYTWEGCTALATFPALDLSAGTNFTNTWYGCTALTSFPAIALTAGTTFHQTWRNCTSMTSFNATGMTLGTEFFWAWKGCSALTTFPAGVFDNWNPASVTANCFVEAWGDCTALTAASVENILNSLATAGVAAPSSGVDITIDYNASSGTPSVASAVSTLKGLSPAWTITLNGVAQ